MSNNLLDLFTDQGMRDRGMSEDEILRYKGIDPEREALRQSMLEAAKIIADAVNNIANAIREFPVEGN